LALKVIIRDGHRCRKCGARQGLTVHHIIKRSKLRLDVKWNLITVCQSPCHAAIEDHTLVIEQDDHLKFENEIDAHNHVRFVRIT
jgi:5-methylcytosine-specific restriction endonuclease McrA